MQDLAASHRRWANRAVAREVDHDRVRWLWGVFVAMLLAAAPFAAYMFEQNECLRLSYRASGLRQERDELMEHERRLRMERASHESLERIEAWALEKHGLVRPAPEQIRIVSDRGK